MNGARPEDDTGAEEQPPRKASAYAISAGLSGILIALPLIGLVNIGPDLPQRIALFLLLPALLFSKLFQTILLYVLAPFQLGSFGTVSMASILSICLGNAIVYICFGLMLWYGKSREIHMLKPGLYLLILLYCMAYHLA